MHKTSTCDYHLMAEPSAPLDIIPDRVNFRYLDVHLLFPSDRLAISREFPPLPLLA